MITNQFNRNLFMVITSYKFDSDTMAANQGTPEASRDEIMEVDVILIDGTLKDNYPIMIFSNVLEEKTRIWNTETRVGPPELQDLILVLKKPDGEEQVMDEAKPIGIYVDDFTHSHIKFVERRAYQDQGV